jgi:hypothetical protein
VNEQTTFEKPSTSRPSMAPTRFPHAFVSFGSASDSSPVDAFLKQRPDARWVLLGQHAVQSEMQLWTAWVQASRNELRSSMVARSIDAEFLRYLAGTHHISEAFSRAGIQAGDEGAWVVHLPQADGVANDQGHLQPTAREDEAFNTTLSSLVNGLQWSLESRSSKPSIEGMSKLGIDVEGWDEGRLGDALLAHILMADDQSSSHR